MWSTWNRCTRFNRKIKRIRTKKGKKTKNNTTFSQKDKNFFKINKKILKKY